MSCLICNELLHDTITCGLIPCVSHINTISPPKIVTQLTKPNKDLSTIPSGGANKDHVDGGDGHGDQVLGLVKKKEKNKKLKAKVKLDRSFLVW
jgi:hypothetical protein